VLHAGVRGQNRVVRLDDGRRHLWLPTNEYMTNSHVWYEIFIIYMLRPQLLLLNIYLSDFDVNN
jgi:hypothetical protein